MILQSIHVRNFRRLRDVHLTLESDRTIFVGANNSGKTSAGQVIKLFVGEDPFLMYDFSAEAWKALDDLATRETGHEGDPLPAISLDLWFEITATDLHRVLPLIPKLDWAMGPVGIRIEWAAKSPAELLMRYREAKKQAAPPEGMDQVEGFWPKSVTDFLTKHLKQEFEYRYYVLDRARFSETFVAQEGYAPSRLEHGKLVLRSLLRVSFLKAQRHMAEEGTSDRAEDLSRRLSRFYESHLEQVEATFPALRALQESEKQLNKHFEVVFKSTLDRLDDLGYPGLTEAAISIRAALNAREILRGEANVHYALRGEDAANELLLPDSHNGLGYKNLIYIVIELLDYQHRWEAEKEERALLHLIIIEEPEAHLHTQMQQVFIREIRKLVATVSGDGFRTQLIVTTHSPHILHTAGFPPIRYFRRLGGKGRGQHSTVLNLSEYYRRAPEGPRDFLSRYIEQTHCDLFFADAAILVEGTVERLLLPAMIKKSAEALNSCYLSVLEVGGAYAHVFAGLLDFLGLTTLVITDLDSVRGAPVAGAVPAAAVEEEEDEDDDAEKPGSACWTGTDGAVTSNQTLQQWLPRKTTLAQLRDATNEEKTQPVSVIPAKALVRVAYQVSTPVTWRGQTADAVGRTFEEDFALRNLAWCQAEERANLRLRIRRGNNLNVAGMAEAIFRRVKSSGFHKTDFALAVIDAGDGWEVPHYIDEGLKWLASICRPEQVRAVLPMPAPLPPGDGLRPTIQAVPGQTRPEDKARPELRQ